MAAAAAAVTNAGFNWVGPGEREMKGRGDERGECRGRCINKRQESNGLHARSDTGIWPACA